MREKNIVIIPLKIILICAIISSIILITSCLKESDDLSGINEDFQRQLTEATANLEELNEELNIVKNELASSVITNEKLSDDNEKLSDDNEKLSDDNEKLSEDMADLTEQVTILESSLEELNLNYDELQIDYTALYESYQETLRELYETQEVQPLKYFASFSLLEDWIDENIEPYQSTLLPQIDFQEACRIVEKGIQDGYWIGISFRYQNTLLIVECSAIAGNRAYTFYPFGGNITPWPVQK